MMVSPDELNVPLARCIPARETWSTLVPALTVGEMSLACKLDDELPAGWTIAVQRRISNTQPDILCFHPRNGLIVIEVKDWNPNVRRFEVRDNNLWATNTTDGSTYRTDDPVGQVMHYKKLLSQFFPRFVDAEILITAVVAMTNMPEDTFKNDFFRLLPNMYRQEKYRPYAVLAGKETLSRPVADWLLCVNETPNILLAPHQRSLKLSQNTARKFSWLIRVPELETERYEPLQLDSKKREFIRNESNASRRKVMGAVGSGKSTLLAARAAKGVSDGKRVLVVSFTITLRHWLHLLIVRAGLSITNLTQTEFSAQTKHLVSRWYIHEFAEELAATAGRWTELRKILTSSSKYPFEEVIRLTNETVTSDPCKHAHKYDLVLVDEIQNIDFRWLDILKQCVADDGEMIIFGDVTQNVYGLNLSWTSQPVVGFPGRWTQLKGSYRFPPDLLPVLRDFYETFKLELEGAEPPEPSETGLFDMIDLMWCRADAGTIAQIAADQLSRADQLGIAPMDTALLTLRHKDGLEVLRILTREKKPAQELDDYAHIFSHDSQNAKHLKKAFWPMSGQKKLCTVHSFQGWEARYIVLLISPRTILKSNPESFDESDGGFDFMRTVYVGLSRIVRSERTATLIVVNAERELDSFLERHFREVHY